MLCDLKTMTVLDRLRIIDRPYYSTNRQLHRKDFITVNNVLTGEKKKKRKKYILENVC